MAARKYTPAPALLGFLMSEPRHGYELYQQYDRQIGRVWQVGRSTLYAELKRLEEAGQLACHTEWPENQRPRKVYRLTEAGRKTFFDWLFQTTRSFHRLRIEFLTRLFFFRHLEIEGLEALLAEQKAVLQGQITSLGRKIESTTDEYWRLVLAFRRGQLQAAVAWLGQCEASG